MNDDLKFYLSDESIDFYLNATQDISDGAYRITEDGDFRVTEDGSRRILE